VQQLGERFLVCVTEQPPARSRWVRPRLKVA
jgi:hypothetical protein